MVGGSGSIGIVSGYSVAGSNGSADSIFFNSLSAYADGAVLCGRSYI